MFVKLNESIINLDLVKEISEVVAYVEGDDDSENYHYIVIDPAEIAHWLAKTAKEGSKNQVRFGFRIYYLGEKFPKHVKVSPHRNDAVKAREALAALLNGNHPVMHEVKF